VNRVLVAAAAALSLTVLTACGASAPPADELADEMIETLEVNGVPVSDSVKDCMRGVVADFEIAPESGFESLDDVAEKASDGQPQAIEIMDRFEAELAACN